MELTRRFKAEQFEIFLFCSKPTLFNTFSSQVIVWVVMLQSSKWVSFPASVTTQYLWVGVFHHSQGDQTGASYATWPSCIGFWFSQGLEEKLGLLFLPWGTEKSTFSFQLTLGQESEIWPSYTMYAVNDYIEMYNHYYTKYQKTMTTNTT